MLPRLQSLTRINNKQKLPNIVFLIKSFNFELLKMQNIAMNITYVLLEDVFYFNLLCYNVGNVYVTGQTIFPSVSQFINKTPL